MITESSIYWILKLDDIRTLFGVLTFALGIVSFASLLTWAINSPEGSRIADSAKKFLLISLSSCMLCAATVTFMPSTKQMAAIKVLPKIVNSEIVGEVSADVKEIYRMGVAAIKEALSENREQRK